MLGKPLKNESVQLGLSPRSDSRLPTSGDELSRRWGLAAVSVWRSPPRGCQELNVPSRGLTPGLTPGRLPEVGKSVVGPRRCSQRPIGEPPVEWAARRPVPKRRHITCTLQYDDEPGTRPHA